MKGRAGRYLSIPELVCGGKLEREMGRKWGLPDLREIGREIGEILISAILLVVCTGCEKDP